MGQVVSYPLLRALNEVDGIEWIRLLYLYPTTITAEVIDAIADLDKVVKVDRERAKSFAADGAFAQQLPTMLAQCDDSRFEATLAGPAIENGPGPQCTSSVSSCETTGTISRTRSSAS